MHLNHDTAVTAVLWQMPTAITRDPSAEVFSDVRNELNCSVDEPSCVLVYEVYQHERASTNPVSTEGIGGLHQCRRYGKCILDVYLNA